MRTVFNLTCSHLWGLTGFDSCTQLQFALHTTQLPEGPEISKQISTVRLKDEANRRNAVDLLAFILTGHTHEVPAAVEFHFNAFTGSLTAMITKYPIPHLRQTAAVDFTVKTCFD